MTAQSITLKHPVTVAGQETQVLSPRRPKVRDMLIAEKASDSEAEKEIAMFANLCDVDSEVIKELDMADYQALQEVYRGFLS